MLVEDCDPGALIFGAEFADAATELQQRCGPLTLVALDGAADAVSLWDLSVEDDTPPGIPSGASEFGVPPQLMFVHQGLRDPKEVKYHPQIPGLCMTTALDGFNVFIPNL